jgi:hypothetical protein
MLGLPSLDLQGIFINRKTAKPQNTFLLGFKN